MKIISNSAISLDGKLATKDHDAIMLGSQQDQIKMSELRNWADAVVVGGKTYRNWPEAMIPVKGHLTTPLNPKKKLCVIVSRSMDVPLTASFFCEKSIKPLFLTIKENIPEDFPCEVIGCDTEITPAWILQILEERGAQNVLIEAGGKLLSQFMKDNCLDEMHVTLCPKIIGGTSAPTLIDGEGFSVKEICNLKLIDSKIVNDEIFLHYKVQKHLDVPTTDSHS